MNKRELLEVGDVLVIKNWLRTSEYLITRVTKTLAFSKRASDGFEHSFKRKISWDMSHPHIKWNTNEYSVKYKEE